MVHGIWFVMLNSSGCELDRKFIESLGDRDLAREFSQWVSSLVIDAGDTFKIEEGWSEG